MIVFAARMGVVAICAVLTWGCADDAKPSPDVVQRISITQARACRVVDALRVENQYSRDEDIEHGALRKAQARVIEAGGNAILVQSTSITSSRAAGGSTVMTLKGQILACGAEIATR